MNILITGATKFVGKRLVESLVGKKGKVFCILDPKEDSSFIRNIDVEIYTGSLSDKSLLDKVISKVDVVHHLEIDYNNLEETLENTKNLINICNKYQGIHFIYYSSIVVNGLVNNHDMISEESKLVESGDYELHRIQSELLFHSEFSTKKNSYTIIRPGIEYGPGDTFERFFLFKFISESKFRNINGGKNKISLCYLENLISASHLVQKNSLAYNEIFIISDNVNYNFKTITYAISRELDVKPPSSSWSESLFRAFFFPFRVYSVLTKEEIFVNSRYLNFLKLDFECSIRKAKTKINYNPSYNLEEGVKETVNWYKKKGMLNALTAEISASDLSFKMIPEKSSTNSFFYTLKSLIMGFDRLLGVKLGKK